MAHVLICIYVCIYTRLRFVSAATHQAQPTQPRHFQPSFSFTAQQKKRQCSAKIICLQSDVQTPPYRPGSNSKAIRIWMILCFFFEAKKVQKKRIEIGHRHFCFCHHFGDLRMCLKRSVSSKTVPACLRGCSILALHHFVWESHPGRYSALRPFRTKQLATHFFSK